MKYIFASLILMSLFLPLSAQTQAPGGHVAVMEMDGAITPAYADYLQSTIDQAESEGAQALLIELNTPGGLLASTRAMVAEIIDAPLPVIIYVTPSGAHAASAGTFVLLSGHVAAMNRGTNVGAATPVQVGGNTLGGQNNEDRNGNTREVQEFMRNPNNEALRNKTIEDTTAFIRAIANMRGRNAEWAEKAVTEARSITAEEALEHNVIDLIASDRQSLLETIDGFPVELKNGRTVTLQTAGAETRMVEPGLLTSFLAFLSDPNVASILMMIGVYGLVLEFYVAGAMIPGTIGAISLLLGLYAMSVLPVNGLGGLLILLGAALALGETFIPSFGILGAGALVSMGIGFFILFDTDAMPGLYLHWQVIAGILSSMILLMGLAFAVFVKSAIDKERSTGPESMIGARATVVDWAGSEGHVEIGGERWNAYAPQGEGPVQPGQQVIVSRVEDLKLKVRSI